MGVIRCWQNGRVVVARLESERSKREVMRSKNILKENVIFIEHERRKRGRCRRRLVDGLEGKEMKGGM